MASPSATICPVSNLDLIFLEEGILAAKNGSDRPAVSSSSSLGDVSAAATEGGEEDAADSDASFCFSLVSSRRRLAFSNAAETDGSYTSLSRGESSSSSLLYNRVVVVAAAA